MLTLALQFNIYFRDFHAVLQKDCCFCLCRCLFRYQKRSTRGRGVTKTTQEAFVNVASCALVHMACGHNTNKRTHALVELKCRRRRRRCCQLCPSAAARTSGLCPASCLLCSGPVLCVVCRCASQNLLTKLKDKHTNKVKTFGHRRKCWASANIVQPK